MLVVPVSVVGAANKGLTVAIAAVLVDTQPVVVTLASAKNVLVAVIKESNVNELLLNNVPAVVAEYQSIVPSIAVVDADTVALPAPQIEVPVVVGADGNELILANTAVLAEKQPDVDLEAT